MSSIYHIELVNGESLYGVIEKHRGYTLVIREFLKIHDHFYEADYRIIPILSIFSMYR